MVKDGKYPVPAFAGDAGRGGNTVKLAVCASFMQSDLWQERLSRAACGAALEFDEFYDPDAVRAAPVFRYAAAVAALGGAQGLETVHAIRERSASVPLLWISDDAGFALSAYELGAEMFLTWDCSDAELTAALRRCGVLPGREAAG